MNHFLHDNPVFSIARVILQTTTPLAVSSGRSNHIFDSDLVRDANGLPMIPGSALAGVLRHLVWHEYGENEMERIFGFQDGDMGGASRLEVSSGVIHDSHNRPAQSHYLRGDALLDFARETRQSPVYRDRVAINERGAAKATGKFDRAVLPAGFRFSVELVLHSPRVEDDTFARILALLSHPLFRLGASTRAGLGAFQVVQSSTAQINLKDPKQATQYRDIERDIGSVVGLQTATRISGTTSTLASYAVALTPIAAWRFGQGLVSLLPPTDKVADMLPKLERRVHWSNGHGEMGKDEILVPAASIKGALRHRAYFHACCEAGYFAEGDGSTAPDCPQQLRAQEAIRAVFGDASDNTEGTESGSVGNLIINDLYLPLPAKPDRAIGTQMHNAIDRFSGGVRNRMLFSEELLFDLGVPLKIDIWLDENRMGSGEAAINGKRAILHAIDDLTQGRLALGGGTSKGHGLFHGKTLTSSTTSNGNGNQHAT